MTGFDYIAIGISIPEEYARRMIAEETMHKSEVDKMLRHPGDVGTFAM